MINELLDFKDVDCDEYEIVGTTAVKEPIMATRNPLD